MPIGFKFNQAVSPLQAEPGRFGTLDNIPNIDFARNQLGITPEFKPEISAQKSVEVVRPVQAQFSIVGEQEHAGIIYPGGRWQLRLLDYDKNSPFVKFTGSEKPLK